MLNITDENNSFAKSTEIKDDGNNNIKININLSFFSMPTSVFLISSIGIVIWTPSIPLKRNKKLDDLLYPIHSVKDIKIGPPECGKFYF